MKRSTLMATGAGIVAAAGLALGGAALAQADTTPTPGASSAPSEGTAPGTSNGNTDPSKPMRSDEQLLTGDNLTTVTAAAKAKEPTATIERVETDSDGVYEAHMVRTDGTHIIVQVGADFAVTDVQVGGSGGGGGHGGPAGAPAPSAPATSAPSAG